MIGFPFDSHVTYEADGTPVYDRAISSEPLRKLIGKLLTDGVLPNPSTNMQVSAGTGMNVLVEPGFAICSGGMKLEESQRTLAVQASDSSYDRIDTVVLRWNDNDSDRICDFYIVEGTPAASPVRPSLTRTESIWELGLADLFISKNSTEISNQRITDTRYETARCGIISSITEFDTTTLYQQVQADLAGFKEEEQADFIAWFNEMKGQLSDDAAGNLQNQIGTLSSLATEVKTNLVSAINWIVDKVSSLINKIGTTDISDIGDGTVTGAISGLNSNLTADGTPFRFGKDAEGNFGYILTDEMGADSVVPFKKGISQFNHFEALAETLSTTTKTVKGASVIFLIGTSASPSLSFITGGAWERVLWTNKADGNYRVQYAIYIGSGDCVVTLGSNQYTYQYCGLVTDGEII